MLAALQAAPETEPPPCDSKHPERAPCTEPLPVVIMPAKVLRLPQLDELGSEAIRVTSTPSLGGRGQLFQVSVDRHGNARLLAVWVYGHPYAGWREIGREEAELTPREYRQLAARVDAALAEPDPPLDGMVCTDGSVRRTERYRGRHIEYYTGTMCSGFGSGTAYDLLATFACRQVGRDAALATVRAYCGSWLRMARREGW